MSDSRRGSTTGGLFHTLKQNLQKGDKHVDADFEAVHTKFVSLSDTLHKLRASSQNYISAIYSVFLHANSASCDFALLLEESDKPNPYQHLAQELRGAHTRLSQDRQQQLSAGLTERVLRPVDELLSSFVPLQTRIAKRNELHADLEYYLNKVHDLTREREDRTAKGKSEKPKDLERFDRNQDKLSKARFEYQNHTSALMADLQTAWSKRIEVVGPALAAFVQAAKDFTQLYAAELSAVNHSDKLTQPPAELLRQPVHPREVPLPTVSGDMQKPGADVGAGEATPLTSSTAGTNAAMSSTAGLEARPQTLTATPITASGVSSSPAAVVEGSPMQPAATSAAETPAAAAEPLASSSGLAAPIPDVAPMPNASPHAEDPIHAASAEARGEAQDYPQAQTALQVPSQEQIASHAHAEAEGAIPRDDINLRSQTDSTYQTPATQPSAPTAPDFSSNLDSRTAMLGGDSSGGELLQASTAAVERSIVVDPTTVLHEQAGYTHESALPGMQQQETFDVAAGGLDKSGTLKSQGEEESKRQKYEEEHKTMGEA